MLSVPSLVERISLNSGLPSLFTLLSISSLLTHHTVLLTHHTVDSFALLSYKMENVKLKMELCLRFFHGFEHHLAKERSR